MAEYTSTYGNMAGSSYTITLDPTKGTERPKTPAVLIVTRAVETKDGWLGQVLVDKEIVFQTDPITADTFDAEDAGRDAIKAANTRVVQAIRALFVTDVGAA